MFDSTQIGVPYKRVQKIVIEYPAALTAEVTFQEQEYVPLADGSHRAVGSVDEKRFTVESSNMLDTVELTDYLTGAELGASMSYSQIMIGILSAIRSHS